MFQKIILLLLFILWSTPLVALSAIGNTCFYNPYGAKLYIKIIWGDGTSKDITLEPHGRQNLNKVDNTDAYVCYAITPISGSECPNRYPLPLDNCRE